MAKPDQLAILKQGVNVWNEWRKEHADEKIDLGEADLVKADLTGAARNRYPRALLGFLRGASAGVRCRPLPFVPDLSPECQRMEVWSLRLCTDRVE